MSHSLVQSDALAFLRAQPADSVDLIFTSPPYELARLYLENGENLGVARDTDAWVAWMVEVFTECRRVCTGLVAFVVEGQTRDRRYSAGPLLLAADLHRAGFCLRKPPIFARVGIPGGGGAAADHEDGGPDWLRNDYELILCTTRGGKLPWADGTACGHPPKWAPGGEMSYRLSDGQRRNGLTDPLQKRGRGNSIGGRNADGSIKKGTKNKFASMSSRGADGEQKINGGRRVACGVSTETGDTVQEEAYLPPALANPGNCIKTTYTVDEVRAILHAHGIDQSAAGDMVQCKVGGGLMGSKLASENEAPFPESLARFFVLSFCRPGGTVLDCFSGSGTTMCVAVQHGRNFVGCDLRASQVELGLRRLGTVATELF